MTINLAEKTFVLTLRCPDKLGLVHAVAAFLLEHESNIERAAQFHDADTGLFFMRVGFSCSLYSQAQLQLALEPFAACHDMQFKLYDAEQKMPTVIFVSQAGHCLNDLLFRWKSAGLAIDIKAIISNHQTFESLASNYGIAFHHIPITAQTKKEAEEQQLSIIRTCQAELVILARYMQVLSTTLCQELSGSAINIHHSFLPSFKGARPYFQAHQHGVKLIGATAHYVTADLDEGPIIEQDVARVNHNMTVDNLTAIGRDTESQVLARAVRWHSEHRVMLNGSKTVVFD